MTSTERRHLRMVGREQVDLVTSTSILMISSKDLMRPSVAFLVIDTLCIYFLYSFSQPFAILKDMDVQNPFTN